MCFKIGTFLKYKCYEVILNIYFFMLTDLNLWQSTIICSKCRIFLFKNAHYEEELQFYARKFVKVLGLP